jgi:hypothetical protein
MSIDEEMYKKFYESIDFSKPMVLLDRERGGMSLVGMAYFSWWKIQYVEKKPIIDFDPKLFPKKSYDLTSPWTKRKTKDTGLWNKPNKRK